jgi:hypothetical protein
VDLGGVFDEGVTVAKTSPQPGMAPGGSNCSPAVRAAPSRDVLELGHGFSHEMLAMLVLAGLATVVTETLRVDGGTFKIERMCITDAGRLAIRG